MTEMVGLTCRVGAHNSRYAHDTRLYPNYMLVSHTRAKKVTWRHSMIYVKVNDRVCLARVFFTYTK